MLDNDDPHAPNGGKTLSLRLSKDQTAQLDELCRRTGFNPSDALPIHHSGFG